ncbi:MAG: hotdog fold domain-containing protein [Solirubrobacteraceae bacterium]|nr:hotdog fold domain-containing protein [Solirubrobacteraceae bacterium]
MAPALDLPAAYERMRPFPLGRAVVSRGYRLAAPYFLTIPAKLDVLEPGRAVASMPARPWTRNHLGTVHAIAQCNLAEFAMGAVAEATVPDTHRWIPRGMTIDYLTKATGTLVAEATIALPKSLGDKVELPVEISLTDRKGHQVSHAQIRIWMTAKRT